MPKYCIFRDCKSDSRFHPWLKFAAFVKPTKAENIERAKRWIYLLDREDFGVKKINKDTYICEKHFPEKDHENLDWMKNLNLEPIVKDVSLQVVKSKSPEPKYNIADLTPYQWYVCPDDTCLYQSKYSYDFEQHMTDNHNCYKAKEIKLDKSGDKTMRRKRKSLQFESSFELMPQSVRDDYENHKILQLNESLDVLPGMIVLSKFFIT